MTIKNKRVYARLQKSGALDAYLAQLCRDCKTEPRCTFSNGKRSSYCSGCRGNRARESERKAREQQVKAREARSAERAAKRPKVHVDPYIGRHATATVELKPQGRSWRIQPPKRDSRGRLMEPAGASVARVVPQDELPTFMDSVRANQRETFMGLRVEG